MENAKDPGRENKENQGSVSNILWAGISLALPILLIYLYSYSEYNFSLAGKSLKKFALKEETAEDVILSSDKKKGTLKDTSSKKSNSLIKVDSIKEKQKADSIKKSVSILNSVEDNYVITDTTKHRVMILGDSECGGLCYPLNDYCIANGHELAVSLVWNCATIYNFAYADTLDAIIKKYKPTFIFFVVGLNELTTKELKRRKVAADLFKERITGIPYAWIGPANYCEDHGLNKVFQSAADSMAFFLSKNLELPRAEDGRHPNSKGYRIWMDSIARWINTKSKYRIAMKKPEKFNNRFKSKIIILNAAKYRGYK